MRIAAILLAFLLLSALRGAAVAASDSVAAVVNGEVITFSQICARSAEEVARLHQTLTGEALLAAIKSVRASALDRLIDRQLYIQEYRRVGPSLVARWTGEQKKAASRGRFEGEHRQWLDRLKEKAYIRTWGKLLDDCPEKTVPSNQATEPTPARTVTFSMSTFSSPHLTLALSGHSRSY